MRVGYVRVSTVDQNTARQLDGLEVERVFTDNTSGSYGARPQLDEMIAFVRDGDTVVVHSMDRLARNLEDLRGHLRTLIGKGVRVEFVKEHLTFTRDDSPTATLLLSVTGAFADFERALILEHQREGTTVADQRDAIPGRKPAFASEQGARTREQVPAGEHDAELVRKYGMSLSLYCYLRTHSAAEVSDGSGRMRSVAGDAAGAR